MIKNPLKLFRCLVLARLILACFTLTCLAAAGTAHAQELSRTHLKVIGTWSASTGWKLIMQPFWTKEIVDLSNGQVTADLTSMTEMGLKGPEVFRLIKIGVADMGSTVSGYAAGEVPELDGYDLAGVIPDIETLRKVVDVYTPAMNEIMSERVGVRAVTIWPSLAQAIWCATPIGGLDDMKGKKVRVFAITQADFMEAIGAVPVTMAMAEVVPAMERKVIDCAVTGTLPGNVAKWPEVATHLYPVGLGWSLWLEVANERSWNRLDPAVQAFVKDTSDNVMSARAWEIADEGTNQGIWCSTGDSRCTWGPEDEVTRYNRTLVPVTEEDRARMDALIQEVALPRFAERCGADCAALWNETVGKVVGMTARAK